MTSGALKYCSVMALATCALLILVAESVHTQNAPWAWAPPIRTIARGQIEVLPVRGNVHMLAGAGGNITFVHAGN